MKRLTIITVALACTAGAFAQNQGIDFKGKLGSSVAGTRGRGHDDNDNNNCVPEPASMAAIAMGVGAFIRRKKKTA